MSYKATLTPSDHHFEVEDDESVLEAGLRQGFALPYGCRNGACGSCAATLKQGEVRYPGGRPPALTEDDEACGKTLLCQARPVGDLVLEVREIGAARDIQVKVLPARVAHMERLAGDVMRLRLRLPATERLQFLAGQYVDVILRDGRRRGFSLANAPHDDEFLELHVRHVPGGRFTDHVFKEMKERAILRFEGPLGAFFLREDSERPAILMAGGTGFAPLKSIIEHAMFVEDPRTFELYWGVRGKADLYLDDLAREWVGQYPRIRYVPVLSDPLPGDAWTDRTGFVHQAVCADHPDLSGHDVYMSGPPAMIKAARKAFRVSGLPEDRLYYDSFEYSIDTLKALGET
jgi:CDP-4-dehydro-6-deoxyglucose reductase